MNKEICLIKKYLEIKVAPSFPLYINAVRILDLRPRKIKRNEKNVKSIIEFASFKNCPSMQKSRIFFYKPISRLFNE